MEINNYLDSTYLKTTTQAGIGEGQTLKIISNLIQEAIDNKIFAVMIRPEYLLFAKEELNKTFNNVQLGTVIDFPLGAGGLDEKLNQAQKAIDENADELDFVVDYNAFKSAHIAKVREEVLTCSRLCLKHNKTVKWIIETAALTDAEIKNITTLIKETIIKELPDYNPEKVFIKSSTGYYNTASGKPNGANKHVIQLMLEYANPLPVKASGGVRTTEDALKMIQLGVKRIGTSSALAIIKNQKTIGGY